MLEPEDRREHAANAFRFRYRPSVLVRHGDFLRELGRALAATFPTPYPVAVTQSARVVSEGFPAHGETWAEGRRLFIRVHSRQSLSDKAGTLCHEWAHAHTWRHAPVERTRADGHDDEFYLALGRIERWWEQTAA